MPPLILNSVTVKYFDKNAPRLNLPNKGDFGIDLFANEDKEVFPGESYLIKTGICLQIEDEAYGFQIRDRSSKSKYYEVLAGIIDPSYTGEWLVRINLVTDLHYMIRKGDKIAQAIPMLNCLAYTKDLIEVEELLVKGDRLDKGFGSTGS